MPPQNPPSSTHHTAWQHPKHHRRHLSFCRTSPTLLRDAGEGYRIQYIMSAWAHQSPAAGGSGRSTKKKLLLWHLSLPPNPSPLPYPSPHPAHETTTPAPSHPYPKGRVCNAQMTKSSNKSVPSPTSPEVFFFFLFFAHFLLSSFWTSRGHRCRPFSPPVLAFNFYRA